MRRCCWPLMCALVLAGCGGTAHPPGDGGADASRDAAVGDANADGAPGDGAADASRDATVGDGGADAARDAGPLRCSEPSDCVLAIKDCCGPCGRPTLADFDAIHVAEREAHRRMVCPDPHPICPGCAAMDNPNLGATCDRATGECVGFDVERDEVSACRHDADCIVRVPDCCPCGADTSPFRLLALNQARVSDYEAMVCDRATACAECEPTYPPNVEAYCDTTAGHCRLRTIGR